MCVSEFVVHIWSFMCEITDDEPCSFNERRNLLHYEVRTDDVLRTSRFKSEGSAFVFYSGKHFVHMTLERHDQKDQFGFRRSRVGLIKGPASKIGRLWGDA